MNSTLVSKVDRVQDDYTLNKCSVMERIFGMEMPADLRQTGIISRLEKLEGIRSFLQAPIHSVSIVITDNLHELSFRDKSIFIGPKALEREGVLEKAILVKYFINGNPMSAEVSAEFILNIYNQDGLRPSRPWFRDVRTLTQYCNEDDHLVVHNEFCAAHNELNRGLVFDGEYGPSPWSLKSLYFDVLSEVFFDSSLQDKKNILANLKFLVEPEDSFIETIESSASMQRSEAQIIQMLVDWILPLGVDKNTLAQTLKRRLMSSADIEAYMVIARSSRDTFPIGEWAKGYHSESKTVAVEFGRKTYFFPSDVGYALDRKLALDFLKPQYNVYVSCQIPSLEQLKAFGNVQNIIFIKSCSEHDVDWFEFARQGIEKYLFQDKNIQFIEFNLPALLFAEKIRGPLHDSGQMGSWQKWLIWQGVEADESPLAQRPLAVIEGVKRFRIY